MQTCAEVLRRAALVAPEATALVFEDTSLTYRELFAASCRLANALTAAGLGPGDRVALVGPHTAHSVEEICALALAGFVRVPLHDGNTTERHLHMLAHSGARALIADAGTFAQLGERLAELPDLALVILDRQPDASVRAVRTVQYAEIASAADPADRHWIVRPDDDISISYTGGTTGASKGTVQTQRSWLDVALELYIALPAMDAGDAFLVTAPLSGATGSLLFGAICRYQPIVVLPGFEPVAVARAIERHAVALTMLLPTMAGELAGSAEAMACDLSSLRAVFLVSLQMPEATVRFVTERLGDVLHIGYGQSESTPVAMLGPAEIRAAIASNGPQLRSVGRPLPRARVRILAEDGSESASGEVGEVLTSTVGTMRCYWRDPQRTAEAVDADGFVRTGDLGRFDDQGFLYLLGRADDRILQPHRVVYPAELEAALADIDAIAELAVVGVPTASGPQVRLVMRARPGTEEDDIAAAVAARLRGERAVDAVSVWTHPLPRTPMGKLIRARIIAAESGDA